MATADDIENGLEAEDVLRVPACLLKSKVGFSLDIGGSLIKLAYCSCADDEDIVVIHFVSYPSSDLQTALTVIKDRLGTSLKQLQTVYTTGVGCSMFSDVIKSTLDVSLANLSEMDCFVNAFRFLVKHFPLSDLVHPTSSVVENYKTLMLTQIMKLYEDAAAMKERSKTEQWGIENADSAVLSDELEKKRNSNLATTETKVNDTDCITQLTVDNRPGMSHNSVKEIKEVADEETPFPCILAMLGSGGAIIKVENDKFMVLDGLCRSGRMFLGLGSLLVGCHTFEELVNLAAQGNEENVNVLGKHLKTYGQDVYSMIPDQMMLYCFGQAASHKLGDFKREDLAAALVSVMAQDIAQCTHLNSIALRLNNVFFCGSFTGQSQLVRDEIGRYFAIRADLNQINEKQTTSFHFLKAGSYLGVLGSLLQTLQYGTCK